MFLPLKYKNQKVLSLEEKIVNTPKIAWITDTTSSLNKEFIDKYNIHVIPLQVIINKESYKETIEITEQTFYERMSSEDGTFQTSQASLGDFVELYENLKEEYDFGIAIHASSILSGTFNASKTAAQIAGFKLICIDSKTGSYPLGHMIKQGIELFKQGVEIDDIIKQIEATVNQTKLFVVPSNLDQLHKSGRVSGSQRFIASLFNILPIIAIEDGAANIKEKVRSNKKAISWILNQLVEDSTKHTIKKVAIIHANDLDKAKALENEVKEKLPNVETEILMLIPVAGVHTGVGTVGLSWVCE